MTEDEARQTWCSEARCVIKGDEDARFVHGINRWPRADETMGGAHCIASDCMKWRWARAPEYSSMNRDMFSPPKELWALVGPNPFNSKEDVYYRIGSGDHTDGFCGLAGEPK